MLDLYERIRRFQKAALYLAHALAEFTDKFLLPKRLVGAYFTGVQCHRTDLNAHKQVGCCFRAAVVAAERAEPETCAAIFFAKLRCGHLDSSIDSR